MPIVEAKFTEGLHVPKPDETLDLILEYLNFAEVFVHAKGLELIETPGLYEPDLAYTLTTLSDVNAIMRIHDPKGEILMRYLIGPETAPFIVDGKNQAKAHLVYSYIYYAPVDLENSELKQWT